MVVNDSKVLPPSEYSVSFWEPAWVDSVVDLQLNGNGLLSFIIDAKYLDVLDKRAQGRAGLRI